MTGPTLMLVLHAHLPYVNPSGAEILEERWLYEAVTETYIPLLWSLQRLLAEGIRPRLTLSLSAPLLAMLGDSALMARCRAHVARMAELGAREATRLAGSDLAAAAEFHRQRLLEVGATLDRSGNDLLTPFGQLAQAGSIALITAAGTHPVLPLLADDRTRRLQIEVALQIFEQRFGFRPAGLWLPECAYAPGLDHLLAAHGIRWSLTDDAAVRAAYPPVKGAVLTTPGGVALFGRDQAVTRQVWDSRGGYPGDPAYREFYRDQGYDLPLDEVAPYLVEGWVRSDTGLKFYRVTAHGPGLMGQKEPYRPAEAAAQVAAHARHFVERLKERTGPIVAPFDAELFGHWWFEGPAWLEAVWRLIASEGEVAVASPDEWLAAGWAPPLAQVPPATWGAKGDFSVWVGPANDQIWPELHKAERAFWAVVEGRAGAPPDSPLSPPVLEAAGSALLLAQASDLPFIMTGQTAVQWAEREFRTHLDRFWAALDQQAPAMPTWKLPIAQAVVATAPKTPPDGALHILMLSWEFPPNNVGGLGRHVHDLGKALVGLGHRVSVLTACMPGERPDEERIAGMRVRRIARPPETDSFLAWVYQLNRSLQQEALAWANQAGPFDLVHAHDWLAGQAGMGLKAAWRVPLVATIHALEQGRNGSINSDLQAAIHEEEIRLAQTTDQVITVSEAMGKAVAWYSGRIPTVIYNGIDLPGTVVAAEASPDPYFFFIGRLVPEKGVQVAIEALSHLPPTVRLLVAGKGPMEAELKEQATRLGLAARVQFLGRVTDVDRDRYLAGAVAGLVPSLYEPFGIVALEVMAAGVPVIVSETGGLREIVTHDQNGLRVYPGDPHSLAIQMKRLLTDGALKRRLVAAANRDLTERFGWSQIAAQTIQVYKRIFTKSL
ncbi:MAG TPA: 1,4-alpha-glucan branching protein domain-containing protein [Symbiobacteriaceae bacterium]|nr:1,4-alpha-glucan branching protein domain-containing protein [Symbiobacteriaceae bacterium]